MNTSNTMLPINRQRLEPIFASTKEKSPDQIAKDKELTRKMHLASEDVAIKMLDGSEKVYSDYKKKVEIFASWRIERVQSLIFGNNVATDFFEVINLEDDELPIIINDNPTMKPLVFHSTGTGGKTYYSDPIEYGQETEVNPIFLTSDEGLYEVDNARTGKTPDSVIRNVDLRISSSLDIEIDKRCWSLVNSIIGAFTSPTKYYVFDDRVVDFPTTNLIAAPSNGLKGVSPQVIKNIGHYVNLLGKVGGQQVALRNIYVPAVSLSSLWDWPTQVAAVSGTGSVEKPTQTVPDEVKNQIWKTGSAPVTMFGQTFNLISVNTLPAGAVYGTTNIPLGRLWTKASLDRSLVRDETYDENKIYTKVRKWFAAATVDTAVPFVVKALYNV